jgi:5-methylcytosine-specific restriction protein A
MPTSSARLCAGCGTIVNGRCPTCTKATRQASDAVRESPAQRGYDSHWRRSIRPAFLRQHPICVLCGALASVPDHWPETRKELVGRGVSDPDADHRLRALCKTCHDRYGLSDHPGKKLLPNDLVTVVAGPPCSGKNTYVEQHAQPSDTVIDYDQIMAEISGRPMHQHDDACLDAALAERDRRIGLLLSTAQRGWIITASPFAAARHAYRCGRVLVLLPPQTACLERAAHARPPAWTDYIRRWYREYEVDRRDTVISPDG